MTKRNTKCGVPNPMNTRSNAELRMGHSITHTKNYQKSVGVTKARCEHNRVAAIMRKRGMKHKSPFESKVKGRNKRK